MQAHVAVLVAADADADRLLAALREAAFGVSEYHALAELVSALGEDHTVDIVVLVADALEDAVEDTIRRVNETLVPLLVVCSHQDEAFVIRALRLGADGCLCEPFGDAEFLARVEAHLRRHWEWNLMRALEEDETLHVDAISCSVMLRGREVRLTPTEFRLLSKLAEKEGEVVTREELCDHVWGLDSSTNPSSLRLYVSHLRRKLEPDPHKPRYIRTKWGVGYFLQSSGSDS